MRTVLFLVLFVLLASFALHRPPLESFLFAVALAVGLTPEFLPMITTVTLAKGAMRMARRNVIVKHLAAIEDFGSMDVLCSDKTGTLTSGAVDAPGSLLGPFGEPAERPFLLAYLNSAHETGIRSPLDEAILRRDTRARHHRYRKLEPDAHRLRAASPVGRGSEGPDDLVGSSRQGRAGAPILVAARLRD